MKTISDLLNVFKREHPNIQITDVYDDDDELLVRVMSGNHADFYFIKKSNGVSRAYFSRSEVSRVSRIIQNNKRITIQNEE